MAINMTNSFLMTRITTNENIFIAKILLFAFNMEGDTHQITTDL